MNRSIAQAIGLRPYRHPNSAVLIGDSRHERQYSDGISNGNTYNRISNAGWMNWTNGMLRSQGKPINWLGNKAVAGSRTDQYIATQLEPAIALRPAMIWCTGFVNDVSAQYPTAGTVVATVVANIKYIAKRCTAEGILFVYTWELGANGYTATQLGNLHDINRILADYFQYGDDDTGPPFAQIIDPTPVLANTGLNTGSFGYKSTVSDDGTHLNIAGAQKLGLNPGIIAQIGSWLRPFPGHALGSLIQSYASQGLYSLMNGASGFAATTAAPGGTGNTGVIPNNCTAGASGGATAVFAVNDVAADANGNLWGKEVQITCTFPATAGANIAFYMGFNKTNLVPGAILHGGWEIDVAAGATNIKGVQTYLEASPTPAPLPTYDMVGSNWGTDPGGYTGYAAEPPPLKLGQYTGTPFCDIRCDITNKDAVAGSCVVKIRKPWGFWSLTR